MTVNEFVTTFSRGTKIKVHMIFADAEITQRRSQEDFGVWGDGYHGITRYPIGSCTVRDATAFCKDNYDIHVWAFEPDYIKKIKEVK